jgi:putative ABC transport system substrate-binding protein
MTSNSSFRKKGGWLAMLILIVVISLLLNGCSAKESPKIYRVGVLSALGFFAESTDGFKAKMTELGYVEGQNIVYDVRESNADPAAEQQALEQFVADEVDLIFSFPTEASIRAKAVTQGTDIPVVFANTDLHASALVESVRKPGGNITGVQFPGPDNALKRFEILHDLMPEAKRIWVAYDRDYPIMPPAFELLHPAATAAGVTLVEVAATSPADIQADLQARSASSDIGVDAILIVPEPLTAAPDTFAVISKFAAEHKVPMGGALILAGDNGTVFGYMSDAFEVGELAAIQAHKIFKGIPAGTIPVLSAESHLRLNYKMAEHLGLTVPDSMVSLASEIIRE